MKTVLSGPKPSGDLHIGNYLGALRHWPNNQDKQRSIFFIPNLHAITVRQDPQELRKRTYDIVAWLLSIGIDPVKYPNTIISVQSMVPEHTQLGWILNNYTTMGELSRMTQYKDKLKTIGSEGQLVGYFDYPVLMAADILLYDTNEVPVGEDQVQHIELTRDIAGRFNKLYGETFVLPKAVLPESGSRIMSLDDPTKKMSKTDHPDSYVMLEDKPEDVINKFKIAVTDSGDKIYFDKQSKGAISNLLDIYSGFSCDSIPDIEKKYANKGYGEFKKDLGKLVAEKLSSLQIEYNKIRNNEALLIKIIEEGNVKASKLASKKLMEVKEKIGLL